MLQICSSSFPVNARTLLLMLKCLFFFTFSFSAFFFPRINFDNHVTIWNEGAHINPAVTFGMAVIGEISPLRAIMYITAHCGGGIAGAALLYG